MSELRKRSAVISCACAFFGLCVSPVFWLSGSVLRLGYSVRNIVAQLPMLLSSGGSERQWALRLFINLENFVSPWSVRCGLGSPLATLDPLQPGRSPLPPPLPCPTRSLHLFALRFPDRLSDRLIHPPSRRLTAAKLSRIYHGSSGRVHAGRGARSGVENPRPESVFWARCSVDLSP